MSVDIPKCYQLVLFTVFGRIIRTKGSSKTAKTLRNVAKITFKEPPVSLICYLT